MRKTICILSLCLAGILLSANDNVIARYDFREKTGLILKDKSGNELNAAIQNGEWVRTEYGSAIKFKGKGTGARVTNSSNLDMKGGSLTVSVFLKIPKTTNSLRIFQKGAGDGSNGYRLYFHDKKLGMLIGPDKPTRYVVAHGNGAFKGNPINDGEWHFIVFVFDREKEMRLYIDGAQFGEVKDIRHLKGLQVISKGDVLIYAGATSKDSCVISDIAVYRGALSELQVKEKHADILQKMFTK